MKPEYPATLLRIRWLLSSGLGGYFAPKYALKNVPDASKEMFRKLCNSILERENAAYRFVGDNITEITSDTEIASIEEALDSTSVLSGVNTHLKSALDHLSDRSNPDYRNSIKESISAVEALCQKITGDSKATLGKVLKVLEGSKHIHPALKKGFSAFYGYTSEADGIRHAMLEESTPTKNDAKFMLVACSAFINYAIGRCAELGISL